MTTNIPFYRNIAFYSSIHQLVDILGWFYFGVIMNNLATNMLVKVKVFMKTMFSFLLGRYLGVELLGLMAILS